MDEIKRKALELLAAEYEKEGILNAVDPNQQEEITMGQEYEYEVWQGHAWQAGGSTETPEAAIAEADHYAMMYGQDGPVEVRFYVKQEVTRAELEARQAT